MSVAIYARVSSESQEARGTIGSQLEVLRLKMAEFGHQVVHEYIDDDGRKTLRSYSKSFDLRHIDTKLWVTSKEACSEANDRIAGLRHYALISTRQALLLSHST